MDKHYFIFKTTTDKHQAKLRKQVLDRNLKVLAKEVVKKGNKVRKSEVN